MNVVVLLNVPNVQAHILCINLTVLTLVLIQLSPKLGYAKVKVDVQSFYLILNKSLFNQLQSL